MAASATVDSTDDTVEKFWNRQPNKSLSEDGTTTTSLRRVGTDTFSIHHGGTVDAGQTWSASIMDVTQGGSETFFFRLDTQKTSNWPVREQSPTVWQRLKRLAKSTATAIGVTADDGGTIDLTMTDGGKNTYYAEKHGIGNGATFMRDRSTLDTFSYDMKNRGKSELADAKTGGEAEFRSHVAGVVQSGQEVAQETYVVPRRTRAPVRYGRGRGT